MKFTTPQTFLTAFTAAVLLLSGIATVVRAQTEATTPEQMQAVEVSADVFVLHGLSGFPTAQNKGFIANLGFVVTDAGVVLIDTGCSDSHAEKLLQAVAEVTDKDVIAVFNTHDHGDHWLGNDLVKQRFPAATVYAHEKKIAEATVAFGEQWVELLNNLTDGAVADTTPLPAEQALVDGDVIRHGATSFHILHTGVAHTSNDVMIHVQPANIVFLGDTAFFRRMGRMEDGSFKGNITALDAAIALAADVYVPGHGPTTSDSESAQAYRDYLKLLYQQTAVLFEEGLSDYEIKEQISDRFTRWSDWSGFDELFGRHISLAFLEIENDAF